jgi:hypothetical protein
VKKRIELLREILHDAIDNGDTDDILKASVALDTEIVNAMIMLYVSDKDICS